MYVIYMYTEQWWYNIYTMMEPRFCICSAAMQTHCRSLFAMLSEKENNDPNPVPSKKHKVSLLRKGKGRFSSVSETS